MILFCKAIYDLHPDVVYTMGTDAFDVNDNKVEYDLNAVNARVEELKAEEEAKQTESLNKLAALGLTPEDLQRILGK